MSSSPASGRTTCSTTPARARSSTSRRPSGLGDRLGFSTSALWFDYNRDGLLDLFVCNYVKWSPEHDVFCSVDGRHKSYCTPEAYRGDTCWLFRNRGDGTFEDVTATSGIFDTSSKSLGVTILDYDGDGWPDLFVANDTQPNKLYRNLRDGTFRDVALDAGVAFSADGKARAGMGVDAGDFDNSGRAGLAITNFENEMIGLYREVAPGRFEDVAMKAGVGQPSRHTLGFGCVFADVDLDGALDLIVANGHIDEPVREMREHGRLRAAAAALPQPRRRHVRGRRGSGRHGVRQPRRSRAASRAATSIATATSTSCSPPTTALHNFFATTRPPGHQSIRFRLRGTTVESGRDRRGGPPRSRRHRCRCGS